MPAAVHAWFRGFTRPPALMGESLKRPVDRRPRRSGDVQTSPRTPRRAVGGRSPRPEMNLFQGQTTILIEHGAGLVLAIEDDGQRPNNVPQLEVGIGSEFRFEPRREAGIMSTVKDVVLVLVSAHSQEFRC